MSGCCTPAGTNNALTSLHPVAVSPGTALQLFAREGWFDPRRVQRDKRDKSGLFQKIHTPPHLPPLCESVGFSEVSTHPGAFPQAMIVPSVTAGSLILPGLFRGSHP